MTRGRRLACGLGAVCALAAVLGLQVLTGATPKSATTKPRFVDVASRSRFAYRTSNGQTTPEWRGRKYFPQPMCGGVALADFDGDGRLDIYFTNGAELPSNRKTDSTYRHCLLRNQGAGTFQDVTTRAGLAGDDLGYSFGVAAGDYDNDGDPDLFLANLGRNTLYRNNGDGSFTDVTDASGVGVKPPDTISVSAAWFDADADGLLDLVVANYTTWTPATDQRCRQGATELYCDPRRYDSVPHRLYRNRGEGRFEDVTDASGFGAARGKGMGIGVADVNRDGWPDVFIANDTERNFLYLNQGKGRFQEAGLLAGVAFNDEGKAVSAMGTDVKDYDNDGWPDVFYNDLAGQLFGLFRNEGGRSFLSVAATSQIERLSRPFSGWSAAFLDYNNDGWLDLYSANGHVDNVGENTRQHDTMFENVGGQSFRDVSGQLGPDFLHLGYQRGAAIGDLNGDGALDLVVTSLGEPPRILLNAAATGRHWLTLDLMGRQSNRDGIGARVEVTTAARRTLHNHASASVGFLSSSDRRVHFGLGAERALREVVVRWPSGVVQRLGAISVDRVVRVEEPAR